ncbi:MAG: hypothetical protein KDC98_09825 [Planctomycetes bacterium]|nr:hypothetical protein [Planctomycetota bacterium]
MTSAYRPWLTPSSRAVFARRVAVVFAAALVAAVPGCAHPPVEVVSEAPPASPPRHRAGWIVAENFRYPTAALLVENNPDGRAALAAFLGESGHAKGVVFGDSIYARETLSRLALIESSTLSPALEVRRAHCRTTMQDQVVLDESRLGARGTGEWVVLFDWKGNVTWQRQIVREVDLTPLIARVIEANRNR